MEDLSLHMLDIMENSLEARARRIEVRIDEDPEADLLTLEIRDDGKGMDAQTLLTLLAGHPDIELRYDHNIAGEAFTFDTGEIREGLGSPQALRRIGEHIRKGLDELTRRVKA